MKIFEANIKNLTEENEYFRKVLFTGPNAQLVVMTLKPGEDIGEEVHKLDQVLFFVSGNGKALLDDVEYEITPDKVFYVPKGTKHNFINGNESEMKLYTVYAPAEHEDGTIHKTKEDAMEDENEE